MKLIVELSVPRRLITNNSMDSQPTLNQKGKSHEKKLTIRLFQGVLKTTNQAN